MESHQSGAEGQNPLSRAAGHAPLDAAQDTTGFLGCEHILPAHTQFFIHQYLQVLLRTAALHAFILQSALILGMALNQVQDLALGLVKLVFVSLIQLKFSHPDGPRYLIVLLFFLPHPFFLF